MQANTSRIGASLVAKGGKLLSPTGKKQTLAAVRPNAGLEAAYRKRLDRAIDEMHASLIYWLSAAYRVREPATMAQDRSATAELNDVMRRLARRWVGRFDKLATEMAGWFAQGVAARADGALKAALRKGGMTVEWKLTAAQNDAVQAVQAENVGLIKSVAAEHLQAVQGLVNRSVAAGRDLEVVAKGLEHQFGVTKRRASLIARHQNNMATATIVKVRQQQLGIVSAKWKHSHGGKHPRPSHVKADKDGLVYEIAKGAFLDGKWTWPGVEINCRCVSKSIVPGL